MKPDFLPAEYWDDKAGIKTDDFAKHYGELSGNAAKYAERIAAVPKDEGGYKPELKLPEGVQVPEGVKFEPAKDPRLPTLLKIARERGWTNDDVNAVIAYDAQLALADHTAEQTRVAEETKKLGEKATERIAAATNWLKGQTGDGKTFTADEANEIRLMVGSAAGVTALEKIIAKATGSVPGLTLNPDPKPAPKTLAERMYPHLPSGVPPHSARSA